MTAAASRFRSGPQSPLKGVGSDAWQRFVAALEIQGPRAVSPSGGLGSFDMRPRRLVELGRASELRYARLSSGRCGYECDDVSRERFLSDWLTQYKALSDSMRRYHEELLAGKLTRPIGVSLAGALAILHVGGRGALAGWPKLFDNTRARYEAARLAF